MFNLFSQYQKTLWRHRDRARRQFRSLPWRGIWPAGPEWGWQDYYHRDDTRITPTLKFCKHESGGLSMIKKLGGPSFLCITGGYLPFPVYFGYGRYPRVKVAFAENYTRDNSYRGFIWPHWSNLSQNEFNENTAKTMSIDGLQVRDAVV